MSIHHTKYNIVNSYIVDAISRFICCSKDNYTSDSNKKNYGLEYIKFMLMWLIRRDII